MVQATLENTWLSSSVEIDVSADRPLDPIHIDAPLPGRPTVLRLVDPAGAPLVDAAVRIPRPAGPIADDLDLGEVHTDGAGALDVSWLEAGKHTLRVADRADVTIEMAGMTPDDLNIPTELKVIAVPETRRQR